MRYWSSVLTIVLGLGTVGAQVTFEQLPEDAQLVPRAPGADEATYTVVGYVVGAANGDRVTADLRAGETSVSTSSQALVYRADTATFALPIDIPAARVNHALTVYLDGATVAEVRDLVAGDVYVVNGQSNAEGLVAVAESDRDTFVRGPHIGERRWTTAQFSNPGLWGGRMASELSLRRGVPVAVFNFAAGAQLLEYFRRDSPTSDNFEDARDTLAAYGADAHVRALVWFQGEADAFTADAPEYRNALDSLLDEYGEGFGTERYYGFQTRTFSCSGDRPDVMEGQRQLHRRRDDFDLMSTMNATHSEDLCHYRYEGGYEALGTRMANLILYREDGLGTESVLPPDVDSARVTGPRELTVYFDTYGEGLAVTGDPYGEFRAEGVDLRPSGGRVTGERLVLTFDADVTAATGITYLSHDGPAPDYVHSANGVGVLTFHDVSLFPGDGDLGNLPDARLALSSAAEVLTPGAEFSATITLYNEGAASLRGAAVNAVLPPSIGLRGGEEAEASTGTFEPFTQTWSVPFVPPGDSATLRLNFFARDPDGEHVLWAQLSALRGVDADSEPGDGTPGIVREDDETRIVFGARERDCVLAVEAREVRCVGELGELLRFDLVDQRSPGSRARRVTVAGQTLAWPGGAPLAVAVDGFAERLNGEARLPIAVVAVADATCGTSLAVQPGSTCDEPISTVVEALSRQLLVYPNPAPRGGVARLVVPRGLAMPGVPYAAEVYDLHGRKVAVLSIRGGSTTLPVGLSGGVYVVAVDQARGMLVVGD